MLFFLYSTLSAIFYSLTATLDRYIAAKYEINKYQQQFWTYLIGAVIMFIAAVGHWQFPTAATPYLWFLLSASLWFVGTWAYFGSQHANSNLSTTVLLLSTSPIFTLVLTQIFLPHTLTLGMAAFVVTATAAIMTYKGKGEGVRSQDIFSLPLLAAFCFGASGLAGQQAMQINGFNVSTFYFLALVIFTALSYAMFSMEIKLSDTDIPFSKIIPRALSSTAANWLLFAAYPLGSVAVAETIYFTLSPILTLGVSSWLFNEQITRRKMAGIAMFASSFIFLLI